MPVTTREEILAAALEVVAERGYRKASLDAIAERVGLTRQGVLHYYPSKQLLLLAILRLREDQNRAQLAADHADKDWPSQLAEVVAYDQKHPCLAQLHNLLIAEAITGGDPAKQYLHDHYETAHKQIVARLAGRYGDRLPSGLTTEAAATALLAMMDGLQQRWLVNREKTDHPEVMRDVLTVLLGSTPG